VATTVEICHPDGSPNSGCDCYACQIYKLKLKIEKLEDEISKLEEEIRKLRDEILDHELELADMQEEVDEQSDMLRSIFDAAGIAIEYASIICKEELEEVIAILEKHRKDCEEQKCKKL